MKGGSQLRADTIHAGKSCALSTEAVDIKMVFLTAIKVVKFGCNSNNR
jgi:hypothetical protein